MAYSNGCVSVKGLNGRSSEALLGRLLPDAICSRGDVRYLIADKLARGQVTLPQQTLSALLEHMHHQQVELLGQFLATAAQHWAGKDTVTSQALPRQVRPDSVNFHQEH
jgi:hypothetical protein